MNLSKFLLAMTLTMTCFFSQATWAGLIQLDVGGWTGLYVDNNPNPIEGHRFHASMLVQVPSTASDMSPVQFIRGSLLLDDSLSYSLDFTSPLTLEVIPRSFDPSHYQILINAFFTSASGEALSLSFHSHDDANYMKVGNIFEDGTPLFTLANRFDYNEGSGEIYYGNRDRPHYAGGNISMRALVPEPSALTLLLLGAIGLFIRQLKIRTKL